MVVCQCFILWGCHGFCLSKIGAFPIPEKSGSPLSLGLPRIHELDASPWMQTIDSVLPDRISAIVNQYGLLQCSSLHVLWRNVEWAIRSDSCQIETANVLGVDNCHCYIFCRNLTCDWNDYVDCQGNNGLGRIALKYSPLISNSVKLLSASSSTITTRRYEYNPWGGGYEEGGTQYRYIELVFVLQLNIKTIQYQLMMNLQPLLPYKITRRYITRYILHGRGTKRLFSYWVITVMVITIILELAWQVEMYMIL